MDIFLLGSYTKVSYSLIKWNSQRAEITILPIHPPYPIPYEWTNLPINEFHVFNLNWQQFFPCHNIHLYSASIIVLLNKANLILWFLDLIRAFDYTLQINIITWMLHQIYMFSYKVKLAAGLNNDPPLLPHPVPFYWINELTNKWVPCYQTKPTRMSTSIKIKMEGTFDCKLYRNPNLNIFYSLLGYELL